MKKYIAKPFSAIFMALMALMAFMAFFASILLAGCGPGATDGSKGGAAFSYSEGIDKNGFWKGIKALDYVEVFDYRAIPIPADAHQVSEATLQMQVDALIAGYITRELVFDRAVAEGDTVNIDYEGKIDGVVFEGGSTMGVGVEVPVGPAGDADGTESFLNGFLEQLVGRMPGDTIDIEVSFPAEYTNKALRGKNAVFETTINHIVEMDEFTDDFVAKNLASSKGWSTIEDMRNGLRSNIQKDLVQQYLYQFLRTDVPVKSIPGTLMEYQEKALLDGYQEYADFYGLELEEYLQEYEDISSVEECLEKAHGDLVENATYLLVVQAVAEDAGMSVSDDDLTKYFTEQMWTSDYSPQVEQYGMPYVRQTVLCQKVLDYIAENAVLS